MTEMLEQRVTADLLQMCKQTPKVVKGYVPHTTIKMVQEKGGLATLEWMLDAPCMGEGFLRVAADAMLEKGTSRKVHPLSLTLEAYLLMHADVQAVLEVPAEDIEFIRTKLIGMGFDPSVAHK